MTQITTLLVIFLFSLGTAWAQDGSWTNKAGHILTAVPVELKGTQVVFKRGTAFLTYPLSVFLPAEQKRLKTALGVATVPAELVDAQTLAQRVLKRLQVLHAGGRLSDEAYSAECIKVRQSFREKAAPLVKDGAISERDLLKITP